MPACRICGVQKGTLGQHLRYSHNSTPAQYKEQYPDAALEDEAVTERRKQATKAGMRRIYGVEHPSQHPAIRQKMRESQQVAGDRKLAGRPYTVKMKNGRRVRIALKQYQCQLCGKEGEATWGGRKLCEECYHKAYDVRRASEIDHGFFSDIRTEQQAYCLGLILTDGHILDRSHRKHRIQIVLKDRETLEKVQNAMKIQAEIYPSGRALWVLSFSSGEIWTFFDKWGLSGNKTAMVYVPPCVPDELTPHLMRGLFDGDGWFSMSKATPALGFSKGSRTLVENFRDWCTGPAGKMNKVLDRRPRAKAFSVGYGGRTALRIADVIYAGATIYMQRKYERYLQLQARLNQSKPLEDGKEVKTKS